jgi:competence protein ComEC
MRLFELVSLSQKSWQEAMTPEISALVSGMVWGGTKQFSPHFLERLKVTGLTHVVSASGSNIGLLLTLLEVFTTKIIRFNWLKQFIQLPFVWWYCLAAGAGSPLIRASLMVTLGVGTHLLGRPWPAWYRLLVVVVVIGVVDFPRLASLSFQLSVAASVGLIQIQPFLEGFTARFSSIELGEVGGGTQPSLSRGIWKRVKAELWGSFLLTLAAQAYSWPLLLHHFSEFSIISFLANPVLLWLTPIIGWLGMVSVVVVGIAAVPLSSWSSVLLIPIVWSLHFFGKFFILGVEFFGSWTNGLWRGELSQLQVVGWWMMVWITIQSFTQRKRRMV